MFETMNESKSLLIKEIGKINAKGDISPSELDNLCKAYKTLREISTIEAMDDYGDQSYGRGRSMRMDNAYGYSYGHDYPMRGESYRRGRGADGRYVSRDGSYDSGYSGHSVTDRMIASLEREMDMAETEYDRNKIQEEIRRLREKKD